MANLRKILKLSDPYPNFGYEIACYLKAILGTLFLFAGIFLFFAPVLGTSSIFLGIIFIALGIYFFWQIRLVRDLVKIFASFLSHSLI